jgi:hypothetical protein
MASRLEVDSSPKAAVHVERHRCVLVDDFPGTLDLPEADRYALPPLPSLTVGLGCRTHFGKSVAKSEAAADFDGQIALLQADRSLPSIEPGGETRNICPVGEWRCQIEDDCIRREERCVSRCVIVSNGVGLPS